jgi:uncharacterized protein (DUF427 family)
MVMVQVWRHDPEQMARRVSDLIDRDQLRYEPIERWVRGEYGGETVVDSKDVWLVWAPGKVVPGWCFPREDVRVDRLPDGAAGEFDDPDLAGRVQVEFRALDRWLEEEDEVVGHPRDPFKRIDIRRSSRRVRVEVDGRLVADSSRPLMLFETGLPTRYYLPREDVRTELLEASDHRTVCAYKGEASHFSANGTENVAWTYPDPAPDKPELRDAIAFYNENVDITVDGQPVGRPSTQWTRSGQR